MMRSITLAFFILLSGMYPAQISRRALFLGNSYTYVNNLPQLTADVALSAGDTLVFDSYCPGGYTLDDHSQDAISLNKIMAGGWDYLVLQEQSQLPSFPYYFSNGLPGMCDTFRDYNACGEIMFYMTWARQNGDAFNCPVWPPVCTYLGMDTLIRQRYMDLAFYNYAQMSPVGAAWRYVRQNYPGINLYQADESHPSVAGTYLAACCFYAAVFKKSPALINYNYVLAPGDAAALRQAAKLVVYDSLPAWDFAVYTPTANFSYLIGSGNNQVNFSNSSLFADSYLWDFGDNTTSTLKNPTHNYPGNGTYTISLTAYNCSIDSIYQSIHQGTVSFCPYTPTISPLSLTLCPGVTDTLETQVYSSYQWFDIYGNAIAGANQQYLLVSGGNIYCVEVSQNNCTERSVPVLVDIYSNLAVYQVTASGDLGATDTACTGQPVALILSSDKPPYPTDGLIDWIYNGQPLAGQHNATLLIDQSGTYSAVLHHAFCSILDVNVSQVSFVFVDCTTGINPQKPDAQVLVYPNPSSQSITVQLANHQSSVPYRVVTILGSVVLSGTFSHEKNELDISALPNGFYLLQTGAARLQYTRLIKQ